MWRELFCQISIQYSPTYGPVFRGDQIDVDLINKSFLVTVTEKWNILVGLTRNNRGNDQGKRGTFHRAFCANIRTLFLDIFCLIFPFLFLLFSFLFISPCYETPVARYQSPTATNYLGSEVKYLGLAVLVYGVNFMKMFLPGHSPRPGAPIAILP